MLAATRRMAIQDFLLIAFSVAVIVLSLWPKGDARQTLVFRHPSGVHQPYSLAAGDPRLAKLERELASWSRPAHDPTLAREKWRAELAEYYANATDPSAAAVANIVRVSFSDDQPPASQVEATKEMVAQHTYWLTVRDEAKKAILNAESRLKRQRMLVGPPPIAIGETIGGGHPPRMFALASLIGLMVASGFAAWSYICPAIRLRSGGTASQMQSPMLRVSEHAGELRLSIPAKWVRVHQPAPIIIRQIAYTAVVATSIACLVL